MTTLNYCIETAARYNKEIVFDKVCAYLKIEKPKMYSETIEEGIKELCVARMCKSIGIKCAYNYKSKFFNFFSMVVGEAISQELDLRLSIADAEIRLIRYDKINLVNQIRFFLISSNVDEAFIDAFNFLDKFKFLAK
ncbi:MAG: hypothetical protein IKM43_02065 [Clostridia bacterium]|nr:hypothetical protein [Clostridia bacterium]